jgi:hypothetical protein
MILPLRSLNTPSAPRSVGLLNLFRFMIKGLFHDSAISDTGLWQGVPRAHESAGLRDA